MEKNLKTRKIERIPHKVLYKQPNYSTGIVSGFDNPIGLKCVFYELENGDLATKFELNQWHEGHKGIGHGGMCYAVADELMGRTNRAYDERHGMGYTAVMTGEITCRYINPAPLSETLYAYGRVERVEGRKRFTSCEVVKEDGTVIINAEGIFIQVPELSASDHKQMDFELSEDDPTEL